MRNNAEQDRLLSGLRKLSDQAKLERRAHLEVIKKSTATQDALIDVKKLLIEEDKLVVQTMEEILAKEEAAEIEEVNNAIKDRSK